MTTLSATYHTRETRPAPTDDDIYEILSNHRRRFALHHLKRQATPVTIGELAEQIAAWETHSSVEAISSSERKRVYTSLQQFHLPKMAAKGVIEYDSRTGTVELTEDAAKIDVYLEVVHGNDFPWSFYYVGLGILNALIIGLVWTRLIPMGNIPDLAWATFTISSFGVSSLIHSYYTHFTMHLGDDDVPPELIPRGDECA